MHDPFDGVDDPAARAEYNRRAAKLIDRRQLAAMAVVAAFENPVEIGESELATARLLLPAAGFDIAKMASLFELGPEAVPEFAVRMAKLGNKPLADSIHESVAEAEAIGWDIFFDSEPAHSEVEDFVEPDTEAGMIAMLGITSQEMLKRQLPVSEASLNAIRSELDRARVDYAKLSGLMTVPLELVALVLARSAHSARKDPATYTRELVAELRSSYLGVIGTTDGGEAERA